MKQEDIKKMQYLLLVLLDEAIEENTKESSSIVDCCRFIIENAGEYNHDAV